MGSLVSKFEVRGIKLLVLALLGLAAWAAGAAPASAQPGLGECSDLNDVVVEPDGRILASGDTGSCPDARPVWSAGFVVALDRQGRPDPSYGDGGVAVLPGPRGASTLLPTEDGGTLVRNGPQVLKLDSTGSIDESFGVAGRLPLPSGAGFGSVAIAPDGAIGAFGADADGSLWVRRYDRLGSPQAGFGQDGVVRPGFDLPGTDEPAVIYGGDVVFDRAGRLLLAVDYNGGDTRGSRDAAVLAYGPSGDLDPAYGDGGMTLIDLEEGTWMWWGVGAALIQPGGSLRLDFYLADMNTYPSSGTKFAVVDEDGEVTVPPTRYPGAVIMDLDFTPSGTLLAATRSITERGDVVRPEDSSMSGQAMDLDGKLLPGFGTDGTAWFPVGPYTSSATAVASTADGGMLLGGEAGAWQCTDGDGYAPCRAVGALVATDPTGALRTDFGRGGVVTVPRIFCPSGRPVECGRPPGARPALRAKMLGRKMSEARLRLDMKVRGRGPRFNTNWRRASFRLPKPLRLRGPGAGHLVKVLAGGPGRLARAPRSWYRVTSSGQVLVTMPHTEKGRLRLRIVIPRSAMGRIPRSSLGRKARASVALRYRRAARPPLARAVVRLPSR